MLLDKKGFYTVSFVLKNCSKKKKPWRIGTKPRKLKIL
jgi:hypothetical protein